MKALEKNHPLELFWNSARWPNFTIAELSCNHCGESYIWPEFLDALQAARWRVGRAFHILSAHRCSLHNARIGGAPLSQHLRLACDIALAEHDPKGLYKACEAVGFTGFGFYQTFLHIDMGRRRFWYGGDIARTQWQILLD